MDGIANIDIAEIEITPEMIEAGLDAYAELALDLYQRC